MISFKTMKVMTDSKTGLLVKIGIAYYFKRLNQLHLSDQT